MAEKGSGPSSDVVPEGVKGFEYEVIFPDKNPEEIQNAVHELEGVSGIIYSVSEKGVSSSLLLKLPHGEGLPQAVVDHVLREIRKQLYPQA
jgi:hypothetical protein